MSKNSSYVINQPAWNKWVQSICACLFLFISSTNCPGQTLVPNGDFEDTSSCPNIGIGSQIWCAKEWFTGSGGSPDYYNLCYWEAANGPGYFGESIFDGKAKSGIAGFFNYAQGIDFSEYLEVKLIDSLKKDKYYLLSADVKASYPIWASDAVDFLFTKDSLYGGVWFYYGKTPQVSNPSGNIISDSINWYTISDTFKAEGGKDF